MGNATIRKISPEGVVSTLAGTPGTSGNIDGIGVTARFADPWALAVDGSGDIYVGDTGSYTIRKILPSGAVSTLAGKAGEIGSSDGFGSAARFAQPMGIAVDAFGNIYVADRLNCTIRKITPEGEVSTLAGKPGVSGRSDGIGSAATFCNPCGVAVDDTGNVFVADSGNSTIRRITASGLVSTLAGIPGRFETMLGPLPAILNEPTSVVLDPRTGSLFVSQVGNILKISF
jgi:streptogramin lyase